MKLVFNYDVDAETAAVAGNYTIQNANVTKAVVQSGALNTVILTLEPNKTPSSGPRGLFITGVKAKDSVATQPNISTTVDLKENVVPIAQSAAFLSANEIEVTFSENITGLANNSFVVETGGQALAITSVTAGATLNKAIITLANAQTANTVVTVKKGVGVGNVVDSAGNKLVDTFNLGATLTVSGS